MFRRTVWSLLLCGLVIWTFEVASAQPATDHPVNKLDLEKAHLMLRQTYEEIRKNYYDPQYHGLDLGKDFEQFNTRIDSARSANETFRIIAAFTLSLHDSHVFFQPPVRSNRSTLGFGMEIIGDKCYITRVRPGTDAAQKLHVGDQVMALHGFKITPADFQNVEYFVQTLSPAPEETLDLIDVTGNPRQETIRATLRKGKRILDLSSSDGAEFWQLVRDEEEDDHLSRSRYVESGDTFIWKFPSFEVPTIDVDPVVGKAMKKKNLIIDLRGNSGGSIETLKNMLGHFFDHEIKMDDRVSRKETKAEMIKPRQPYYQGNVTVLVDRHSASAAELFARVIQLEHRGQVVGDRTAGAVMEARDFTETIGTDYLTEYGLSITSANILMKDGKSLENSGVTPDQMLIPRASDLAESSDPVLANAAEHTGVKMTPAEAGKLFPYEWPSL